MKLLLDTSEKLLSHNPDAVFVVANNISRMNTHFDHFMGTLKQSAFVMDEVPLNNFMKTEPKLPTKLLLFKRKTT